MPLHVRCILCLEKDIEKAIASNVHLNEADEESIQATKDRITEELISKQDYDISSQVLGKNIMEDMQLLGQAMVAHMQLIHPKDLARVGLLAVHWNGFNVMKFFESKNEDGVFEKEKESMRDKLAEELMMYAPDEDEEFEDEDEDLDDDENNDLTREDDEDDEENDEEETLGSAKKE